MTNTKTGTEQRFFQCEHKPHEWALTNKTCPACMRRAAAAEHAARYLVPFTSR